MIDLHKFTIPKLPNCPFSLRIPLILWPSDAEEENKVQVAPPNKYNHRLGRGEKKKNSTCFEFKKRENKILKREKIPIFQFILLVV